MGSVILVDPNYETPIRMVKKMCRPSVMEDWDLI